jgi:hypothetical protein
VKDLYQTSYRQEEQQRKDNNKLTLFDFINALHWALLPLGPFIFIGVLVLFVILIIKVATIIWGLISKGITWVENLISKKGAGPEP